MVKNIEHQKRTIPSPKKSDKHSCHFRRGFRPVPHPPFFFFTTKTRDQASQQGGVKGSLRGRRLKGKGKGALGKGVLGAPSPSLSNGYHAGYVKGRELELDISILAIANFKNL